MALVKPMKKTPLLAAATLIFLNSSAFALGTPDTAPAPAVNTSASPAPAGAIQAPNAPVVKTAAGDAVPPAASGELGTLADSTVVAKLDRARDAILPELGASVYAFDASRIDGVAKGRNGAITDILLRAPGVAQDGAGPGAIHVRGEHSNLQYRINGVILPEGFSGFGGELDTRLIDRVQLVTGSLPAQYGFRTAGIVDIRTRTGAALNGADIEAFGGSHDTYRAGASYGQSTGDVDAFVSGSYTHTGLGIEKPTSAREAIHDDSDQYRAFGNISWLIDDVSRVSLMAGGSYANYQLPNTPGLAPGESGTPGNQWVPGSFDSTQLNETQNEQNYFGAITYQRSNQYSDIQLSGLVRNSSVDFKPDVPGDLFFNGVASEVQRKLNSGGLQLDIKSELDSAHTLRAGGQILGSFVDTNSRTQVFNLDGAGDPVGPAFPIDDRSELNGLFAGVYVQDEWRALKEVTVNYGARFDSFSSSFDNETQLSPRLNLVWNATKTTTVHAGYARYFTPPPVESVSSASLSKYAGTSNAPAQTPNSPVRAERSHYFDAGVEQRIGEGFRIGVDGYYKVAKNQLDDGYFGQSLIPSTFNYEKGEIYGVELTAAYDNGGFSVYGNGAYSIARGKNWNSSQFLFDPAESAYVADHWIYLDHAQQISASFGVSYTWKTSANASTRFFADVLYGSGLRDEGEALPSGLNVPNGGHVPDYCTLNLGVEQRVKLSAKSTLKARIDLENVADANYVLRSGDGVGVNAAQYGRPFGVFGTLGISF